MNTENAKKMMDAFYEAKRIRDQLPPLPEGVHSSYVNTLDAILTLSKDGEPVRVSDVADLQRLPRPAVTRTIKEMEQIGLVRKIPDEHDRRVVLLAVTEQGKAIYHTYVVDYFASLTRKLVGISDEDAEQMVRTIRRVGEALRR